MRTLLQFVLLLTAAASPVVAQGRWKEIGKTSVGNSVYVDPRSVKTVSGIINARIRVKFTDPVKTPEGVWVASHHVAMFDCAHKTVAAKESIYYSDEAANKVVKHTTIAQPGFGPAIGGSMTQVALDYMCKKP
ncbi:MAG TPA: surface-adhesin E family protein [Gemmatimonadaceae bacterium]|nr:surface-adhesin E family protein [Gemmatimonadaceae bacterium]